jgi:predicted RNA-binding Zn-ribbon protein involved in translation (DUF1610 family)
VVAAAGAVQRTADGKSDRHDRKPHRPRANKGLAAGFLFWAKCATTPHRGRRTEPRAILQLGNLMSSEKSVVVIPQAPRQLCPICGKASYSAGGVHPQCAMQKADEPRLIRLKAARAAEAKLEKPAPQTKSAKSALQTWKKRCPKCGTQIYARQKACKCGHKFATC